MGKQSRKRGKGKADKRDRKARIEQRKETTLDTQVTADSVARINLRTILVGDRVWFQHDSRSDGNDHNTRRGIVREIHYTSSNTVGWYSIQPLKHFFEENEETWSVQAHEMISRDFHNWTTRFGIGDQVVCSTVDGWLPATIAGVWHIRRLRIYCYRAICPTGTEVCIEVDHDIRIRPYSSSFRFSVNDEVSVDLSTARHQGKNLKKNTSGWVPATVTKVDIIGLEFYAVYECEYRTSSNRTVNKCWVLNDTDEYIAAISANPRERIMDSIRQDCGYSHFCYLTQSTGIDASPIKDLIVSKAVEFGCFGALQWLEYEMNLKLASLKFDNGNTILHEIAQSNSCHAFLKSFARASFQGYGTLTSIHEFKDRSSFYKQKNDSGETFPGLLLKMRDLRVLDCIFSPKNGLFWVIDNWFKENDRYACLNRFFSPISRHGLIVSSAVEDMTTRSQIIELGRPNHDMTEEEIFEKNCMKILNGPGAVEAAKRLVRFVRQYGQGHNENGGLQSMSMTMRNVSTCGFHQIFRSLVEADRSLLGITERMLTSETRNEFVQEEVYPSPRENGARFEDISTMITCGRAPRLPRIKCWDKYLMYLQKTPLRNGSSESLLGELEDEHRRLKLNYEDNQIVEYQINLLQDPPTLSGRLLIMDYLVSNSFIKLPSPLLPIRMRQCGVLRWLVDKGHVRLDDRASSQLETLDARKVEFLGGQEVPESVSSGTFLCFACVEYDSLFALQWLAKDSSVALDGQINGFNILHACAYFGRLEIILWLHRSLQWRALSSEPSSRKGFEKQSALQIALSRGFTNTVDLMISLAPGVSMPSLETMALKSPHEHVRMWGQQRSQHVGLSKDVRKLIKMLSKPENYQAITEFILATGCMTQERWNNAGVHRDDQPLPSGATYQEVLLNCFASDNEEFVLWLCHEVSSETGCFGPVPIAFRDGFVFWTGELISTEQELSFDTFIEEYPDDDLLEYWRQPWATRSNIEHPDVHPFLANGLLSNVMSQRFREELQILLICNKLVDAIRHETSLRILSGASGDAISELHSIQWKLAEKSIEASHSSHKLNDYYPEDGVFTIEGQVRLGFCIRGNDATCITKLPWPLKEECCRRLPLYCFVAIENYRRLVEWLFNHGEGWSSDKEIAMARIASYLGHDELVGVLQVNARCTSSYEIEQAILLGAGEAGREIVCRRLLESKLLCDKLSDSCLAEFSANLVERTEFYPESGPIDAMLAASKELHVSSLTAVIVQGYLSYRIQNVEDLSFQSGRYAYLSLLRVLAKDHGHSPFSIFEAAIFVLNQFEDVVEFWESLTSLFEFLHEELCLDFGEIRCVKIITNHLYPLICCDNDERLINATKDLLCVFERWGLDIQGIDASWFGSKQAADCSSFLSALQQKQHDQWAQLDLIKAGRSLKEIRCAVVSGRLTMDSADRDGQRLVHIAAAYDRVDVLAWLFENNERILEQKDRENRNALDSSMASNARAATDWLRERKARRILSNFLKRHVRRRLTAARKAICIEAVQRLQSWQRGLLVRRRYHAHIILRIQGADRYRAIWETPISALTNANAELPTWSSLLSSRESRGSQIDDIDQILESREALGGSVAKALDEEVHDFDSEDDKDHEEYASDQLDTQMTPLSLNTTQADCPSSCDTIHLSTDVVKWFKRADGKFQKLFKNKIERLSRGERSHTLKKTLKGSVSVIYESYLEQKSGQRVMWQQEKDGTIFIWYVAKHKNVSRLMTLIDDCKRRASRQRILATSLQDGSCCDHQVRLDPLGNVPLKVYEVHADKLLEILDDGWVPKLYLSREERDIVESHGTVLLLGRSGTGKTVCICNRIDLDFWRFQGDTNFKQLFVARSRQLCRYVAEIVGERRRIGFVVYLELMRSLEEKLPVLGHKRDVFRPTMKMDFARFKREVFSGKSCTAKSAISIDPMVVWTTIRTILKGSIEALDGDSCHCDKASFLALGKKRCRLSPEERESVYTIFNFYQDFTKANHLWDDCDRTVSLLKRLNHAIQSNHPVMNDLRQSKLYVDEIQDFTQAEILLFFRISGPGDLFLAGDPAQSVVEGVEFRFEEIRSVGYHVAGNRRDLIPQKPKTVTTNFRSHSGVLDVAGAILRRMLDAFPDTAKQLGEDRGVFNGPRPGVFHSIAVNRLKILVSEKLRGVAVLTNDSSASYWKKALDYELVYGVRSAKGLEFKSVIVLDFFAELPSDVQKPWRELMLGRDGDHARELEGQLKLLYTAVTRCIERLFFAETRPSVAGDAFVRWLTTTSIRPTTLATRQNIDDIEKMATTQDEWVARGLDNAKSGEMHAESNDLVVAQSMVEKAIYCFEEGKDMALARKARTYRTSLTFRSNIPEGNGANEAVEIRAAEVIEQLGTESLLLEARRVLGAILPSVDDYSREQLEKGVLRDPILNEERILI